MNCPFPVSSLWSSKRLTGWPAPKRILPGRMFISLSFELLVGLSGVLAAFLPETTHSIRCNKCANASDALDPERGMILPQNKPLQRGAFTRDRAAQPRRSEERRVGK